MSHRSPIKARRGLRVRAWFGLIAALCIGACAGQKPVPRATRDAPKVITDRYWRAGAAYSLPARLSYPTDTGVITTVHLPGALDTTGHPFFTPLGDNGRACITCHQPADGMSLSARTAREVWQEHGPSDPLFAAIDGSNCPSLPQRARASHSLLLEHGLFRIARPWPPRSAEGRPIEPEFDIELVTDPTGCNADPRYGLASEQPAISVFRRPRPSANLKFATAMGFSFDPKDGLPLRIDRESGLPTSGNLLADDRERTLLAQARDALRSHTDLHGALPSAALQRILAFETQLYSAASHHLRAGALDDGGANRPIGRVPVSIS